MGELILEFPFPPEASQELIIEFPLPFPGAVVRINNKGGVLLVKTFSIWNLGLECAVEVEEREAISNFFPQSN